MDPNSLLDKSSNPCFNIQYLKHQQYDNIQQKEVEHFEPTSYKVLRFLNVLALLMFMLLFCLTYIFIGFNHHFLILQIEAAVFSGSNFIYVNLSHEQKLKFVSYIKISVYLTSIFSFGVCGLFTFLAIEDTENVGDLSAERMGKWMLTFITFYLAVIASFILNAREFKIIYIDNAPEEESDDEEDNYSDSRSNSDASEDSQSNNSDEIEQETGDDLENLRIKQAKNKKNKKEKMEVIYIS